MATEVTTGNFLDFSDDGPTDRQRRQFSREMVSERPSTAAMMMVNLASEIHSLRNALASIKGNLREALELNEELLAPPRFHGICLGTNQTDEACLPLVAVSGGVREVNLDGEIDPERLQLGAEVILAQKLNRVLEVRGYPRYGLESGSFRERRPDGRFVVDYHGQQVPLWPTAELSVQKPRHGDLITFHPFAHVAYECLGGQDEQQFQCARTPRETFADVGGLEAQIAQIREAIEGPMRYPELYQRWSPKPLRSIILAGPPGTGKTLIAKATANFLAGLTDDGHCPLVAIKAGELLSKWYGESEANIRRLFDHAKELMPEGPVPTVIFFDEIDGATQARGQALQGVNDRVLGALLSELDGFEDRGNVLVLCATNRLSSMDEAAIREGRLGDLIINVPRPGPRASRDILDRYFPAEELCQAPAPNCRSARDALLDAATTRLFAPNGSEALATVLLNDHTRRDVRAADLVSGAELAGVMTKARTRVIQRAKAGGLEKLTLADVHAAIDEHFAGCASTLARHNAANRLDDVNDGTVVDVLHPERVEHEIAHFHYRELSVA